MRLTPEEIGWRMKSQYIRCFFCGKPTDMKDFNPRMRAAHGACEEEYWKREEEMLCRQCHKENWNCENSAYCLDCLKKMEAAAKK